MEIIVPATPQEPRYPICNCDAEDCHSNNVAGDCHIFSCSLFHKP